MDTTATWTEVGNSDGSEFSCRFLPRRLTRQKLAFFTGETPSFAWQTHQYDDGSGSNEGIKETAL